MILDKGPARKQNSTVGVRQTELRPSGPNPRPNSGGSSVPLLLNPHPMFHKPVHQVASRAGVLPSHGAHLRLQTPQRLHLLGTQAFSAAKRLALNPGGRRAKESDWPRQPGAQEPPDARPPTSASPQWRNSAAGARSLKAANARTSGREWETPPYTPRTPCGAQAGRAATPPPCLRPPAAYSARDWIAAPLCRPAAHPAGTRILLRSAGSAVSAPPVPWRSAAPARPPGFPSHCTGRLPAS